MSTQINYTDFAEMMGTFKQLGLRNLCEFMDDVKGKKENSALTMLSNDGTVHESTSNVRARTAELSCT